MACWYIGRPATMAGYDYEHREAAGGGISFVWGLRGGGGYDLFAGARHKLNAIVKYPCRSLLPPAGYDRPSASPS